LAQQGRLALLELVEEELLLGMPQIPRSPEQAVGPQKNSGVSVTQEQQAEPMQQPFAGLADLMKKQELT